MSTQTHPDTTSALVVASGLGAVGGLLSVMLQPASLGPWQRVACVVAGSASSLVGSPLIPAAWPDAPPSLQSLAGFLLGLSGMFLIRGFLAWAARMEAKLPDVIDARTGIDTKPNEEEKT